VDDSCGSKRDNNRDSRGKNTKLFNYSSEFQRNSTIRLRCFNGNSVIDDNLKCAWTFNSNMPITLAFVALNCEINFEKSLLMSLFLLVFLTSVLGGGGWILDHGVGK